MTPPLTISITAALDAVAPAASAVATGVVPLLAAQLDSAGPGTAVGLWVARAVNYLALTALVGLLLSAVALMPVAARLEGVARSAARMSAVAAGALAVSGVALFVLGGSSASGRPLPEVLDAAVLGAYAGTRFGAAVLAQCLLAALAAAMALAARTPAGAAAALAIAVLSGAAPAWWGHAGSHDLQVLAVTNDWLHVVAITVWVGGLAALLWLARHHRDAALLPAVERFSRIAGWALVAALVTGAVNALLGISEPAQLLNTTWGRLVVVKVLLLGGLAWFGQQQRRRSLPELRRGGAAAVPMLRRIALVELALMVAAVGVAAAMTSGVPAEAEAAARVQSVATSFGDGQINITVDPATAGVDNEVHLYVLTDGGRPRQGATHARMTFRSGGDLVDAALFPVGPGHWTAIGLVLPRPGRWEMRFDAVLEGRPELVTATIEIR